MTQLNEVLLIVISIVTLLSILVGVVAWNIRLESKVNNLEKNHSENVESVWKKLDDVQKNVIDVLQSVARMEGKIDAERN
jgi:sensor domain CHASE-containing protein